MKKSMSAAQSSAPPEPRVPAADEAKVPGSTSRQNTASNGKHTVDAVSSSLAEITTRSPRDPEYDDGEIESLLEGIAEVSKHTRNVFFALISVVVIVLLAAAADREATLDREHGELRLHNLSDELKAARVEMKRLHGHKATVESELKQWQAKRPKLEAAAADASALQSEKETVLAKEETKIPELNDLKKKRDQALNLQRAAERVESQRGSVAQSLYRSSIYIKEIKPSRDREGEAEQKLRRLERTEPALRRCAATNDAFQCGMVINMAGAQVSARILDEKGKFVPSKIAAELEAVTAQLPTARGEYEAAHAALSDVTSKHADLWAAILRAEKSTHDAADRIFDREEAADAASQRLVTAQKKTEKHAQLTRELNALTEAADEAKRNLREAAREVENRSQELEAATAQIERLEDNALRLEKDEAAATAKVSRLVQAESDSSVPLPLVSVKVKPGLFFLVAPWLVVFVSLYLGIYSGELMKRVRWFDDAGDERGWSTAERLQRVYPWLMNFARYGRFIPRVIAGFALDWMAPLALFGLMTIYLRGHAPDAGVSMSIVVAFLAASTVSYWAAFANRSWTSLAGVVIRLRPDAERRLAYRTARVAPVDGPIRRVFANFCALIRQRAS